MGNQVDLDWAMLPSACRMSPKELSNSYTALCTMLQHTGPLPLNGRGHAIEMNDGGWLRASDIRNTINICQDELVHMIRTSGGNLLQGARLVNEGNEPINDKLEWVRAVSGHSIKWIDPARLHTVLSTNSASRLSTLCHYTSGEFVQRVLRQGLCPNNAKGLSYFSRTTPPTHGGSRGNCATTLSPFTSMCIPPSRTKSAT